MNKSANAPAPSTLTAPEQQSAQQPSTLTAPEQQSAQQPSTLTAPEQQSPEQPSPKPLRLLAQNSEDFHILSGLLQDSILVPANVRWKKKANCFTIPLSRFCWELIGQSGETFFRVASCLVIEKVARAQQRGFTKEAQAGVVNLLACELLATDDQRVTLRFTFSGGAELCLFGSDEEASPLLARLTDIGEVHETQSIPQHRL